MKPEIEKLYDKYGSQMYTCALSIVGCPQLAEDAIHEAFCKGLRIRKVPRNPKAYFFKSVRNAAIDILRKRRRVSPLPAEHDYIFTDCSDPGNIAEINQLKRQTVSSLMSLSEDERETVIQHVYADLTFIEIAEIREKPLGTVTSWYRRGIEKMRKSMRYENE